MWKFKCLVLLFGSVMLVSGCCKVEVLNGKGGMGSNWKFLIMYWMMLMVGMVVGVIVLLRVFV